MELARANRSSYRNVNIQPPTVSVIVRDGRYDDGSLPFSQNLSIVPASVGYTCTDPGFGGIDQLPQGPDVKKRQKAWMTREWRSSALLGFQYQRLLSF